MTVPEGVWGGPQVNKFEQVSSVYHQLSVAGGRGYVLCLVSRGRGLGLMSRVRGERIGPLPMDRMTDGQTLVKTLDLPSRNFFCGW